MQWLVEARPGPARRLRRRRGRRRADRARATGGAVVTVGVGEKACLPVLVTALGEAGHASTPHLAANAVPRLATLIDRIAAHRPERRVLPVVARMIRGAGRRPVRRPRRRRGGRPGEQPRARRRPAEPAVDDVRADAAARLRRPQRDAGPRDGRRRRRLLPGETRADLERELRAALGDDLPYELAYPEPLTGGTVIGARHAALRRLRVVRGRARPRRDAAARRQRRVRRLLLHAQRAGAPTCYGFWPMRHTPLAVVHGGVAQPRRAASTSTTSATRRASCCTPRAPSSGSA